MVRFEPVRSAEPPTSSGSTGTRASSTFCEALRVAMTSPLPLKSETRLWIFDSKSGGNSPFSLRSSSAASSGNWAL
jgi:hypothetical protein